MLPSFSRGLRLALVLAISTGYVVWHGHGHPAYAKGGGDDDDGDDSGDDDKGGKGGEEEGDDAQEDDKDQPAVTAGGLFTIDTYPVREIGRPLTMTQKITQLRLALGTDLSSKGAFSTGGLSIEGVHGLTDNFSLIGGLTDAYNFKQFSLYFGFEGALAYDFVDVRLAANLHRFAIARFCGSDPQAPVTCDSTSTALPSGNYDASGTKFSVDLGFPFRYSFTPEIAIVALQTLISIDFNGQQRGDPNQAKMMGRPVYCSGVDASMMDTSGNPVTADPKNCIENGAKPDINPSIGIAANPIPPLSVVVFAQFRVPDFDFSAGNFQIPVTARVEFSPSQKFDVGLEFTLLNVKPPEPQSPIDNRFLSLFVQSRFGK